MRFKHVIYSPWFLLILLYFMAFFLVLMNDGAYNDDWKFYGTPVEYILKLFHQSAFYDNLLWFWLFYLMPSLTMTVLLIKITTFITIIGGVFFLNLVLKTVDFISAEERFFIVATALLVPFESGRHRLTSVHYHIDVFLFFFAFYLTTLVLKKPNIYIRPMIWILFFVSFFTNSLLVFHALVLFYILYINIKSLNQRLTFKMIVRPLLANIDIVLLPIVFWLTRLTILAPYGPFATYNQVTVSRLLYSPILLITSFFQTLTELTDILLKTPRVIDDTSLTWIILFTCTACIYPILNRAYSDKPVWHRKKSDFAMLLFGILAFNMGFFPYNAVGYTASFVVESRSRDQILLPLGFALSFFFSFKLITDHLGLSSKLKLLLFSAILALFTITNVLTCLEYLRDTYKQWAIVEAYRKSEIIRDHHSFLFVDETTDLNARKRPHDTWYSFLPLLRIAFGDETRFGTDTFGTDIPGYREHQFRDFVENGGIYHESFSSPEYIITIKRASFELTYRHVLKLLVFRILDPEEYRQDLGNVFKLEYQRSS